MISALFQWSKGVSIRVGCPSTPAPPEGPSDALDTASETTAPSDTAMDTLPPSDTAPETPPSGDAVVSTRTDLAPWLGFDITLDAPGVAEGLMVGFEIDLFAVPATHRLFDGTPFSGYAELRTIGAAGRTLTNG